MHSKGATLVYGLRICREFYIGIKHPSKPNNMVLEMFTSSNPVAFCAVEHPHPQFTLTTKIRAKSLPLCEYISSRNIYIF